MIVVVLAKDAHAGEGVLAQLLDALVETGDEVAGHEDLAQLLGELVLADPDGVALRVKVLPEEVNGDRGVLVGV